MSSLRLAWRILGTKTDLGLFNTVLALCLTVSGESWPWLHLRPLLWSAGTVGGLSLSATIWLLLLGQEQEHGLGQEQKQGQNQGQEQGQEQEESSLREVLCWVHVQANYGQWIFYVTTLYGSRAVKSKFFAIQILFSATFFY